MSGYRPTITREDLTFQQDNATGLCNKTCKRLDWERNKYFRIAKEITECHYN